MGIIGGEIGYRLLRAYCPGGETGYLTGEVYKGRSKIEVLFGARIWDEIAGKVVIDFGWGEEAIDIAQHGAKRVIGLDLRERLLSSARERPCAQAFQIPVLSPPQLKRNRMSLCRSMDSSPLNNSI